MFSEMLELYFKIVAVLVLIGLLVALGLGFAVGYWVGPGPNEVPIVTSEPIEVEFGSSAPVSGLGTIHNQHERDRNGIPLVGFARGPGLSIDWKGAENEDGATPSDVCGALLSRLKHLQLTTMGSDSLARAIWDITSAKESLEKAEAQAKAQSGAGFSSPLMEVE